MPRETFKYLREQAPVFWHEDPAQGRGFWAVTRHEDLDCVSKNPQLFASELETCFLHEQDPEMLAMMRLQLINMDPPKHLKYRRLVRNAFTPRKVDSYEPRFRKVARDILDRAVEGGSCEFVKDVAAELPLIAICELMGVPIEKRSRLFELTNIMIGMDDPELATTEEEGTMAMMEMFVLAQELAAGHRAKPRDDIVGVLLDGTVEDEPLTDDEFCYFFMLLICLGSHLARLELKVIFEEILLRIRNPRFDGELNWLRSHFINGLKSMPISFDVVER
jgi:cholest-4-en-3-one 26-monooxygenase